MRHKLSGREYKLLLDPEKFPEPASLKVANAFWTNKLRPIIDQCLDRSEGGGHRWDGAFRAEYQRTIRFWDSGDCMLTRHDLALRERIQVKEGPKRKQMARMTLKLRVPDMFVAGSTSLPGSRRGAETKLEEDIAPLEVGDPVQSASPVSAPAVVVPQKRSTRSRFSLSTTQLARWQEEERTFAGAEELFPTIRKILREPNKALNPRNRLCSGPDIMENVYEGARIKFGSGVEGRCAMTFWRLGSEIAAPAVVEISFKCATIDHEIPGEAARRALELFLGMQTLLGDVVNLKESSKTAMVLPSACRNQ